ncbi:MAG: hypothetical protein EX271_10150 [Acidimicrobiales bacterium]|nr:hypothetical protein [Hyphomonadaceae bacterium]RZV40315.1 MAG: hypothetical protein EX271_10150 [Acidimicrobiales bacterium]
MKPETNRLIAAVFLAPLSLACVWGLIWLIMGGLWQQALFVAVYSLFFAFLGTLLFGLPSHIVLNKSKQYSLRDYLIAAGMIGLVPVAAMGISMLSSAAISWQLIGLVAAIIIPSALFTAGVAWAIVRPDKSEDAQFYLAGE